MEETSDNEYTVETKCQTLCRYSIKAFKIFIVFLFSHVGLMCAVAGYAILGGYLFQLLELPNEIKTRQFVVDNQKVYADYIMDYFDTHDVDTALNKVEYTKYMDKILKDYEAEIYKATAEKNWDGKLGDEEYQWSFADSLLYSVTVMTTIGYGNITPKTSWGRIVTIIYSMFGIPLTMLCLKNIGNLLAGCFRIFYRYTCVNMTYQYIKLRRRRLRQKLVNRLRNKTKHIRQWASKKHSIVSSMLHHNSSLNVHSSEVTHCDGEKKKANYKATSQKTERVSTKDKTILEALDEECKEEMTNRYVYNSGELHVAPLRYSKQRRNSIDVIRQDYEFSNISQRKMSLSSTRSHVINTGANHPLRHITYQNSIDLMVIPENSEDICFDECSFKARNDSSSVSRTTASNSISLNDFEEDERQLKEKLKSTRDLVPISVCILIVVGYLILGTMIFTPWEESWNFLIGFYFCFITLTTVGFGDYVPGMGSKGWNNDEKRVICAIYLLFGMALLAMSFQLVQKEVKHKFRKLAIKIGLIEEKLTKMLDSYAGE